MGRLIYALNVSLDGYVETPDHSLDWANVDEEVHAWFNEAARGIDASLYGRRMYELMNAYWPTAEDDPEATPMMREFAAIWRDTPRIVFSRTLASVDSGSRLVAGDVGAAFDDVRRQFHGDLDVGGPHLAWEFIRRGLVDAYRLVVHPVVLGAGTPYFPPDVDRLELRLVGSRAFSSGAVLLDYVSA